jgi:uncharacterized protein (TIGR01777 family)
MPPRTIVVAGASGLIGSALIPALERSGNRVLRLVRRMPKDASEIRWNPSAHAFDEALPADASVIVNLAGESVGRRWTAARRRRIRDSRIDTTDALVTAIGKIDTRPMTLINASAIGFYGDRGSDVLDEQGAVGPGFLAGICRDWEAAASVATRYGARVVTMRSGLVLSSNGGALAKMLTPFRLGIGGRLGSGRQWMSWIALDDLVRGILWLIDHPEIAGPVNMTSPNPVTNAEFTRALGKSLARPAVVPVPRVALQILFGEMADETLLASQRALPRVLLTSGFSFEMPTIDVALVKLLG